MAPLEDLQQLERMGTVEVEFAVHAVQIHITTPLPGLVQTTDPHITLISLQPRILLIENFLSATECQASSLIICILHSSFSSFSSASFSGLTASQHQHQQQIMYMLACRESSHLLSQTCTGVELPEVG